jgi:proteasome lid subunit RPN8/RPN11
MQFYRMEDSLVLEDLIGDIKEWLKTCRGPEEPCGVIHLKKGKAKFIPINNISDDPNNCFVLDPKEFTRLNLTGEILYIVHGHPEDCIPSKYDISCCNNLKIPYVIFNRFNFEYYILTPENYKTLSGRQYEFGKNDCFEATRDWYLEHGLKLPPRRDWIDDWWLEGYDYMKDVSNIWPFIEVKDLQYGDLLTFAVDSQIENHMGVYVDNDCFFHHAVNRISCKENLYPFWARSLKKVYRYEGSSIKRVHW